MIVAVGGDRYAGDVVGLANPGAFAIGDTLYEGAPVASLGTLAFVGGAWQSSRGGAIDSLLRLDLGLSPAAEGGAVVDVHGSALGMAVFGPRRRVLAITSPGRRACARNAAGSTRRKARQSSAKASFSSERSTATI